MEGRIELGAQNQWMRVLTHTTYMVLFKSGKISFPSPQLTLQLYIKLPQVLFIVTW